MNKISIYLTYAGAIPFIVCAVFLNFDIVQLPLLGYVEKILSVYGLVISSFLAGAHWGQHLRINKGLWTYSLAILSNIIAVLLWFGFLVLGFKVLMAMFAAAFVALLIIDYRLFHMDFISRNYFQTRLFVSVTVIISLSISGIVS